MPEFFNVLPPAQALQVLLDRLRHPLPLGCEEVSIEDALGRVTAEPLYATEHLPAFPRSAMDGYSLRAADTFGASEGLPAYFTVTGEVPMGQPPGLAVTVGEAAVAYTGGMLADGADAVVMMENTQVVDADTIEVVRPVAPGENVVNPGEDVKQGEPILPSGHYLRAQDLGGLTAMGITRISVARRPTVAILSMGDEVVPPDAVPKPGQIRDVNTYTISSLVRQAGGVPIPLGIARDDYSEQMEAAQRGLESADVLLFSREARSVPATSPPTSSTAWGLPACWCTGWRSAQASPPSWAWWAASPLSACRETPCPPWSYSTCWCGRPSITSPVASIRRSNRPSPPVWRRT